MNLRRPVDVASILGFSLSLDEAPPERRGDWIDRHIDARTFLYTPLPILKDMSADVSLLEFAESAMP